MCTKVRVYVTWVSQCLSYLPYVLVIWTFEVLQFVLCGYVFYFEAIIFIAILFVIFILNIFILVSWSSSHIFVKGKPHYNVHPFLLCRKEIVFYPEVKWVCIHKSFFFLTLIVYKKEIHFNLLIVHYLQRMFQLIYSPAFIRCSVGISDPVPT